MTRSRSLKYVFALGACILAMLAIVPASFAGEDDGDDSTPTAQVQSSGGGGGGGGGGDTGSASGGVQTGFGGMATTQPGHTLAIELAGGGVLLLAAAGTLARRRVFDR
jgi:hypothetical protein